MRTITLTLISIVALASPAFAHNSSITLINVRVEAHDLVVTLSLNQSDLLEHLLQASHAQGRFADRQEYEDAAARVFDYAATHLHIRADSRPLARPIARDWPIQHVELTHLDINGVEVPSTIPLILQYPLPQGARRIEVQPDLYAGPNFAAVFDVSLYPGNGAKPLISIIENHQPAAFELATPSTSAGNPTFTQQERRWHYPSLAAAALILIASVSLFWIMRRTLHR